MAGELPRSLGILGTTADPIQRGHIAMASLNQAAFQLTQVAIVPAWQPPHKPGRRFADYLHRSTMSKIATLDNPKLIVSDTEYLHQGEPYTYQTAARLRAEYDVPTSYCFIGADLLPMLTTWAQPERLLTENNIVAMFRPGYELTLPDLPLNKWGVEIRDFRRRQRMLTVDDLNHDRGGVIYLMDDMKSNCCSTDIRRKLRAGEDIDSSELHPNVLTYIEKYRVYPPDSAD